MDPRAAAAAAAGMGFMPFPYQVHPAQVPQVAVPQVAVPQVAVPQVAVPQVPVPQVQPKTLQEMVMVMESTTPPPGKLNMPAHSLESQVVLQKIKIKSLERSLQVAQEWVKKERTAKRNFQLQVARRDAKIERLREKKQADPPAPAPIVIYKEKELTEEDRDDVVKDRVRRQLKPTGAYGENCAQMCQQLMKYGISMNSSGPVVRSVLQCSLGVDVKGMGITLDGSTVKKLRGEENTGGTDRKRKRRKTATADEVSSEDKGSTDGASADEVSSGNTESTDSASADEVSGGNRESIDSTSANEVSGGNGGNGGNKESTDGGEVPETEQTNVTAGS